MYRRAYAGGTFDLFHHGHVELFRRIREEVAASLVVSLNTDAFAKRYKRLPVMTLSERSAVIAACRYVDDVIVNVGGADSRPAIEASEADCIVHGNDWLGPSLQAQMCVSPQWLAERRIHMVYLPYTQGISSRDIEARIVSRAQVVA